ncbi:MAG: hypothetical protein OEZ32_08715 [Nitrospinota bacterium]|nr:hypothetical protein [Nitrospinota bacterium]
MGRLKDDFDEGMAPYFLIAATPVALVVGALAPTPLFPFILPLAVYPVFFHFTRQGRLCAAFWMTAFWGALCFALVTMAVAQDIGAVRAGAAGISIIAPAETMPGSETMREQLATVSIARIGDLASVAALSGVSGGALALVAGTAGLNHLAVRAGRSMADGGGLDAAVLSFPPWMLFRAIGLLMLAIGVSYIFILKLEGRPMEWRKSLRWAGMGVFFLAMDTYFYLSLRQAWAGYLLEAM